MDHPSVDANCDAAPFSGPLGISVDDDGNLYVPDPAGSRVVKFNGRDGW